MQESKEEILTGARPALPLLGLLAIAAALGIAAAIGLAGIALVLAAPAYGAQPEERVWLRLPESEERVPQLEFRPQMSCEPAQSSSTPYQGDTADAESEGDRADAESAANDEEPGLRYAVLRVLLPKREGPARLTLPACYPCGARCAGGPLRYVVVAFLS